MTILRQLLSNVWLCALLASPAAMASSELCEQPLEVLKRSGGDAYVFASITLKTFYCGKGFEGPHFKVVEGTSDKAVAFEDSPDVVRRAATVYHYASEARKFWLEKLNAENVRSMGQIILRLNMARDYSKVRHFGPEDVAYNNARTVPAGSTPRFVAPEDKKSWRHEIWFRPSKVIDVAEMINPDNIGSNPVAVSLRYVEKPIMGMAQSNLLYEGLDYLVNPEFADQTPEMIVLSNFLTIAAVKGLSFASRYLDYVFVEDEFYIDTALVPEIIYHEFAHIALSDALSPSHSLPVIEGMADYFTAAAMNKAQLYEPLEGYYLARSKDAENDKLYHPKYELGSLADKDFTLSVIWRVRAKLEKLNLVRLEQGRSPVVNVDQMVFHAREYLNEGSQIYDLANALVRSCQKLCSNRRAGLGAIRSALEEKGFN